MLSEELLLTSLLPEEERVEEDELLRTVEEEPELLDELPDELTELPGELLPEEEPRLDEAELLLPFLL